MSNLGIWNIQNGQPTRLSWKSIDLEKNLEGWIELDSSLVNSSLIIVGRQVHVDAGFIDLLALDRLGNYWTIIEIKRGKVSRDTIAQALDYLACVNKLSASELRQKVEKYFLQYDTSVDKFLIRYGLDESIFEADTREVSIYVVGTGQDESLNRISSLLSLTSSISINVVTFETFDDGAGNWLLTRQLEDLEDTIVESVKVSPTPNTILQSPNNQRDEKFQAVRDLAHQNGIGEAFDVICEVATKHGLHCKTYSKSVTYAPPSDKRRYLIYTPVVKKQDGYYFQYEPSALAEFFPIDEFTIRRIMGIRKTQWEFTIENARKFANNLDELFEKISES